jgi:hypothetical protein
VDLTNHRYNVNVKKTLKNNDNVYQRNNKDFIADKLVEALNNPEAREYYCKVAWRLPEATIWNCLETAVRGNHPAKYFSWLTKQQMEATNG